MKKLFFFLSISFVLISCCPAEKDVISGKAVEKHYRHHKFMATYSHQGSVYLITYKNFLEERKEVMLCKPNFRNGEWIVKN